MLKKNSIVKFIFLAIIAILGILLCVCPFNIPTTTKVYNGFFASIEKSIDISGGVVALYDCETKGNDAVADAIDNSLDKLTSLLAQEKFNSLNIVRQGDNKVRIEVAGAKDTDAIFAYLENGKEFSITAQKVGDDVSEPTVYVSSQDIASAKIKYDNKSSAYGIEIKFTSNGVENIQKLKTYANKISSSSAYTYLGDVSSSDLFAEISIDNFDGNKLFVTPSSDSSYAFTSNQKIQETLYTIISGSLDVKLNNIDTNPITPILGQNTMLYIGISSAIILLAVVLFMLVKYRELGLLGLLSLAFYLILDIFFLQAIPIIVLNLAGIFAVILTFVLATLSQVVIFEKIKAEYAVGKKIYLSCKGGLKKSLWTILDSHFVVILMSFVLWICLPGNLVSFSIILLAGAIISMFASLVLTRWFINIYLPINSTKANRLNLKREAGVKEIKDEDVEIISDTDSVVGGSTNE